MDQLATVIQKSNATVPVAFQHNLEATVVKLTELQDEGTDEAVEAVMLIGNCCHSNPDFSDPKRRLEAFPCPVGPGSAKSHPNMKVGGGSQYLNTTASAWRPTLPVPP